MKILAAISLPIFLFSLGLTHADKAPVVFALNSIEDLNAVSREYGLDDVSVVFASEELLATYRSRADSSVLYKMKNDPRIVYAEADQQVATAVITTNDPFFTTDSSLEDRQWYLGKIKISEAWEFGRGSSNVVLAIIDTGIHASHLELNDGRVAGGYNSILNQEISPNADSDDNGHGTAVAGVIGAIANNSRGIAGINWNVRLMPVKALEANGTGLISSVASAIVWAADHGANIINLSLGGNGFGNDQTLNNSIIYAFNKGVVIVAAAGNDLASFGSNLDTSPVYPVCADAGSNMIIGVAATDNTDRKAAFSNFGINCVDITAPGKKILTTTFLPSNPANNILIYGSGTSLATPIVSGVAALLKANNPNLSNVEIRNILLKTADNIDPLNQDNCLNSSCNGFLGKGRLNALSALSPQPIFDQSLVREAGTGQIYLVQSGSKRLVSDFVFQQRGFSLANVANDAANQLVNLPAGYPLPPLSGTLVKGDLDPTVYIIHQDLRRALTYLVFVSRSFSFANVQTLPQAYVNSLQAGDWYWPPDGTMVLISGNPTVYVMNDGVRRPVTYFVFIQRKLSFAKVISVTLDEFSHVPAPGDPYWLAPVDGTLVKSASDATVYVVESATKRALSFSAFISRGYKFSDIKTLPLAEMDVIAPGTPIL